MNKKRILFVAPNSYPMTGAEANVNAKMIKLLSEAGYLIDLVSRAPRKTFTFYPPSKDDFLFSKLNNVSVVKVNTTNNIQTIFRHFRTYLKTGYVYKGADWSLMVIKECERLMKNNKYDFIYTYDHPSELVGLYFAKKHGIKWVSVWNDPYIWKRYPEPYGRGVNFKISNNREKMISDIGRHLYKAVFPSDRLRDYMLQYMTNLRKEICVISPHVLLDQLCCENTKKTDGILKIIHSGALGRERDPESFLRGVRMLLDKRSDIKIELSFLGIFDRANNNYFDDLISKYNLDPYIKLLGRVEYSKSLEIVKEYDLCLLIEAACVEGIFLPSKIIDYMQNNKPILALSPSIGVLNDMYNRGEIDYFADVLSVEQISNVLEKAYDDYVSGGLGTGNKDLSKYRNEKILSTHYEILNQ